MICLYVTSSNLNLKEDNSVTISVDPIHFLVLYNFPPNCSQPGRSNPILHAHSIICCNFDIQGMKFPEGNF